MNGDRLNINKISIPQLQRPLLIETKDFPVSQEALFLLDFTFTHTGNYSNAVDLGSGTGLLALSLGAYRQTGTIIGIEIQSELVDIAKKNCILNNLTKTVAFKCSNLKNHDELPSHNSQDLVIANPPFRKLNTGKTSPSSEVSQACHEMSAKLTDYVYAASLILRHHGYFASVILPERLLELTAIMQSRRIEPCLVRFIHHCVSYPASAALVLGRKNGNVYLKVLPSLFVNMQGSYENSI